MASGLLKESSEVKSRQDEFGRFLALKERKAVFGHGEFNMNKFSAP